MDRSLPSIHSTNCGLLHQLSFTYTKLILIASLLTSVPPLAVSMVFIKEQTKDYLEAIWELLVPKVPRAVEKVVEELELAKALVSPIV